ncbi:MAG: putative CAAX amino terminal protease self-immunity [Promethearchaeota archaeon]|nr:MAG: putative CAAX amino terminal protease self-immunity [Candidatus Lokiarchaeota archaeon]
MSDKSNDERINWVYCPRCGYKLSEGSPDIAECPSCGLNFQLLGSNAQVKEMLPNTSQKKEKIKLKEEEIINNPKAFWRPKASIFWPLISLIIMSQILGVILIILVFAGVASFESLLSPGFIIVSSIAELVFMVVPVLYVGQYLQNPSFKNRAKFLGVFIRKEERFFTLKESLLGIGFAVVCVFIVNLLSLVLEIIFNPVLPTNVPTDEIDVMFSSSNLIETILLSIIMIVIIGPSEEIAFRGFMQRGLVRSYNKKKGIWITAIIFALIHVVTVLVDIPNSPISTIVYFFVLFAPYLLISLILGYLFSWRNENLIAPILTHGVYNAITVILAFLAYRFSNIILWLFFIAIGVVSLLCFLIYYYLEKSYIREIEN